MNFLSHIELQYWRQLPLEAWPIKIIGKKWMTSWKFSLSNYYSFVQIKKRRSRRVPQSLPQWRLEDWSCRFNHVVTIGSVSLVGAPRTQVTTWPEQLRHCSNSDCEQGLVRLFCVQFSTRAKIHAWLYYKPLPFRELFKLVCSLIEIAANREVAAWPRIVFERLISRF